NFDEVLRVIDSLQLTAKHKVATPVNWKEGDKVIIAGSVSNDEAKETYPDGPAAEPQLTRQPRERRPPGPPSRRRSSSSSMIRNVAPHTRCPSSTYASVSNVIPRRSSRVRVRLSRSP